MHQERNIIWEMVIAAVTVEMATTLNVVLL
jgi:hypothetical protein